jgi:hypothetical protein
MMFARSLFGGNLHPSASTLRGAKLSQPTILALLFWEKCPAHAQFLQSLTRRKTAIRQFCLDAGPAFDNESTGTGLEFAMCELYDGDSFTTTVTKDREPEAGRLMYSLLGGITREEWDSISSKSQSLDSGFLSRINIIGTEEERRKGKLHRPKFEPLRNKFFPLIQASERNPRTLEATPNADVLNRWFAELTMPEGVSKPWLNIRAWRNALHLAWLRGHDNIAAADAESAIRIAKYQVQTQEFYAPAEGETCQARCEAAIRKAMRAKRRMPHRMLKKPWIKSHWDARSRFQQQRT